MNTFTITPSGELSIAYRLSARLTGPAGIPITTNTFMKSVNASGVCGAAIIATSSALDVKHSLVSGYRRVGDYWALTVLAELS